MRRFVLFHSSFRHPGALNIAHETFDGTRTLCGRHINPNAQIEEDDRDDQEPDCRACAKVRRTKERVA
jgi:hypothetical protein